MPACAPKGASPSFYHLPYAIRPGPQVLIVVLGQGDGRRVAGVELGLGSSADALSIYMGFGRRTDFVGLKRTRKEDHFCLLYDDDVVRLLRAAVEREGNQSAFAKRYGVQRTELNAILKGRKPVTAPFAKALGLRIRKVYVADKRRQGERKVRATSLRHARSR